MARTVHHNQAAHKFELVEDNLTSIVEYELDGQVMDITHTIVPDAVGGRGIAGDLNKEALNTARQNGWKVKATCPYTAAYIKRHPEFQDLLA